MSRWAIKGPRGYFAADGSQSAWVDKVDLNDAYGATTCRTKSAAEEFMKRIPLMLDDRVRTKAVKVEAKK